MVVLATNVNDGVLLVETAQRLRAEGMARLAATRAAAELRLRPRLMTTLPVSLGFVPLAFALESGGELLRPLAVAAIGGLLAAVLVALYLVPVLYSLIGARDGIPERP
jgi:multidrug efflux pump subunit AcrB